MLSGAMLTRSGKKADFGIGKGLSIAQLVNPHPGNADQFVGLVFFKWDVVFLHAGNHTRTATRTLVQVDDHSKLVRFAVFANSFHQ
jgi:hypothetical protein